MMRSRVALRRSCALLVLAAVALGTACDGGASCPGQPCHPLSDGTPFDLLDWCQTSGLCLRDTERVPVCPHADATPPPSCSLGPVDAGETLSFPIGMLRPMLAGRRDLIITYGACERDGAPPDLQDVQVLFDGVPASCATANPCDPAALPTIMTCAAVPSSVELITLSFSYSGAQGMTSIQVEMQNQACSYVCS